MEQAVDIIANFDSSEATLTMVAAVAVAPRNRGAIRAMIHFFMGVLSLYSAWWLFEQQTGASSADGTRAATL